MMYFLSSLLSEIFERSFFMSLARNTEHPRQNFSHFSRPTSSANSFTTTDAMRLRIQRLECAYNKDSLSLSTQSLMEEVAKEQEKQQKREQSGDRSEPWYYLSRTGFFVYGQVQLFLHDLQQEVQKGKSFGQAVDFCAVKVREDLKGFEEEYLKQLAALKWNIGWTIKDGVQKLKGVDYNDALLDDLTGEKEREGALRAAWFEDKDPEKNANRKHPAIETWLRTADIGSKVLLVSPSGWSGFDDFTYPQTQIYYVEVGEGKSLKSFTFRYDVSLGDNEALQKAFGVHVVTAWNERDRIKNMLGNPILIAPDGIPLNGHSDKKVSSPLDVIDVMQEIKGSDVAFADNVFGKRTFTQMREIIKNPDKFLVRSQESDLLIETFRAFAKEEFSQGHSKEETTQRLEIALALIVMQVKNVYFGPTNLPSNGHVPVSTTALREQRLYATSGMFQNGLDYVQELEKLRELPGCAGGGSKVRISSLGGSRSAENANGTYETCGKIRCAQCGWEPGSGEAVGERCPVCTWKPGEAVDENWSAKKDKTAQTESEKSAETPKKVELPKIEKPLQIKKTEPKQGEKKVLPERRGSEQKAA